VAMKSMYVRACLSKRPWASEEDAKRELKRIRKQGSMAAFSHMNYYKCLFCAFWHLGHTRGK
jgi:hypothetical protein